MGGPAVRDETILLVEDGPHEGDFLRGLWEDGDERRGFVLETLKSEVEVRACPA